MSEPAPDPFLLWLFTADEGTKQPGWGCVDGCLNRVSMVHCDSKTCPCGETCSNRPFHLLKQPRMEAFLTDTRWVPNSMGAAWRGTWRVLGGGQHPLVWAVWQHRARQRDSTAPKLNNINPSSPDKHTPCVRAP